MVKKMSRQGYLCIVGTKVWGSFDNFCQLCKLSLKKCRARGRATTHTILRRGGWCPFQPYARHRHTLQTAAFQPHGGMPLVIKNSNRGRATENDVPFKGTAVPTAGKNATQRVVDLRPYSLRPKRTLVQFFYGTKVLGCFDNFCQKLFLW